MIRVPFKKFVHWHLAREYQCMVGFWIGRDHHHHAQSSDNDQAPCHNLVNTLCCTVTSGTSMCLFGYSIWRHDSVACYWGKEWTYLSNMQQSYVQQPWDISVFNSALHASSCWCHSGIFQSFLRLKLQLRTVSKQALRLIEGAWAIFQTLSSMLEFNWLK